MNDAGNASPTPSSPEELAGLIACQPDAIVSRTLLKNPCGSLTLFAFDAGQELSEHTTPHEAVVLVLEGSAEITVGGQAFAVTAGRMLHLPAGIPHAVRAVDPFKMLLVMLRQPAA